MAATMSNLESMENQTLSGIAAVCPVEQRDPTPDGAEMARHPIDAGAVVTSDIGSVSEQNGGPASGGNREASPSAQVTVGSGDSKSKEAAKQRKKEDKTIEHILKALNSLSTPEEKLAALCKKYADLHEDHRVLQNKFKQSQKKLTGVTREKDQLQTEHSKSILAKSKLESLCRELQRHNKLVKEESLARAREEEEKRKEVTNKFQTTISEIQAQMNDHYAKNTKLREENLELSNKLKELIEQYELREQRIEKIFKHKELEQQLADAKLAQANLVNVEEKEKNIKEKEFLLTEASQSQKKIALLEEQEKALRAQVALYTEKYEEFQQTLAKSNEVFQSFKTEMDKMTKKIKKLEKETAMWRQRWENSNKALLEMAEEKTRNDKDMGIMLTKNKKLESLCRALQQERNNKLGGSQPPSREGSLGPIDGFNENDVKVEEKTTPLNSSQGASSIGTADSGVAMSESSNISATPVESASQSESSSVVDQTENTTGLTDDRGVEEELSEQLEASARFLDQLKDVILPSQSESSPQLPSQSAETCETVVSEADSTTDQSEVSNSEETAQAVVTPDVPTDT